ncbi:hypothetical protein SVIO_109250 [Streptomyces violaceusniger]|uniref:Uncharacterized protein n=1 Tax=Streptomyces violaceusniger TaxID=68280 RepID=A0A4D4LG75_STRVO|nr:hypothetical protein SVIO_109250 [Streptomyces violaceusniger]
MFLGHVPEVHPLNASSVRDDHIEVPALLTDSLDHIVEITRHCSVRGDRRDMSLNGSLRGFERLLPSPRDVDVGAFASESLGNRQTKARAPASDEGDLMRETHAFSLSRDCEDRAHCFASSCF